MTCPLIGWLGLRRSSQPNSLPIRGQVTWQLSTNHRAPYSDPYLCIIFFKPCLQVTKFRPIFFSEIHTDFLAKFILLQKLHWNLMVITHLPRCTEQHSTSWSRRRWSVSLECQTQQTWRLLSPGLLSRDRHCPYNKRQRESAQLDPQPQPSTRKCSIRMRERVCGGHL